jgi:hypothetical protein
MPHSDGLCEVVTALTRLGLPSFDRRPEAPVGWRATPIEMMLFTRPLEQDHYTGRITFAAKDLAASTTGRFAALNRLLVHLDIFVARCGSTV